MPVCKVFHSVLMREEIMNIRAGRDINFSGSRQHIFHEEIVVPGALDR